MVDKIFGADFTDEPSPLSSYTLSVNTGSVLVDVSLANLLALVSSGLSKNLIVNGDMQISQRAPGASVASITSAAYVIDRYRFAPTNLGTWTLSQDTDNPSGYGFSKSLKLLVTTADAAPAAADNCMLQYRMEGQHAQSVRKGTASAKQLTLSFWVKSSTTGTYIVELHDNDNTRHVCSSYSISAANTWELKTITFPADTTGALDNDANLSLSVHFWLAAGSNYTSGVLQTSWAAVNDVNRAVGQVNLGGTLNNNIFFTGIQLEIGPSASTFEFLPFDVSLARCQRYYFKTFPYTTTPAQNGGLEGAFRWGAGKAGAASEYASFTYPTILRVKPTLTFYNPSVANAQVRDEVAAADCASTAGGSNHGASVCSVFCTGNASTAVGNALTVHVAADAEL